MPSHTITSTKRFVVSRERKADQLTTSVDQQRNPHWSVRIMLIIAALKLNISVGTAGVHFRKWRGAVVIGCLLFLGVGGTITIARSRLRAAPLKFEVNAVDSVTGKRKTEFFLGEVISIVFTLTNQSRAARTITELEDTLILTRLNSLLDDEDTPKTYEGGHGGTDSYTYDNGVTYVSHREPLKMTLFPGQSVSVRIDDLTSSVSRRLQNGNYTFTAMYNYSLKATVSFRIVIDEAKSVPVLEKMAAAPVTNGDESDRIWANSYLREIRQPSIGGRVTDADGRPLGAVRIKVAGPENTAIETRSNGRYHLTQMTPGGTFTLTPELHRLGKRSEASYTFDPPSRTVTNLSSHLTGMDFIANRVRANTNVASDYEGATVRASSALDENGFFLQTMLLTIFGPPLWEVPTNFGVTPRQAFIRIGLRSISKVRRR